MLLFMTQTPNTSQEPSRPPPGRTQGILTLLQQFGYSHGVVPQIIRPKIGFDEVARRGVVRCADDLDITNITDLDGFVDLFCLGRLGTVIRLREVGLGWVLFYWVVFLHFLFILGCISYSTRFGVRFFR